MATEQRRGAGADEGAPAPDPAVEPTPGEIFDRYEATGDVPAPPPEPPPPVEQLSAGSRPSLTIVALTPRVESVKLGGELYELRLGFHYSIGKQQHLVGLYNTVIEFMRREEEGGELDGDEEEQRLFLLRKLARAATPDLGKEALAALSVPELESLAIHFFSLTRTRREEAAQAALAAGAGRPILAASSPSSNGSTAATPVAG